MAKNKYNISVVGQSNTGKSTLINYLNGKYITTESKKTQTTRINLNNMIQIKNLIVNITDTPGISLNHKDLLSSSMKNAYIKTLESIDLLILMTEISNKDFNYEESILKLNSISNTKVFVVINKIDLFNGLFFESPIDKLSFSFVSSILLILKKYFYYYLL